MLSACADDELLFKFLSEEFFNTYGHQPFHRTAEAGDLFYDTGAQIGVLWPCHEKDGFDAAVQPSIHERHLKLILKIGYGAQTFDDHGRAALEGVVYQQAFECVNTHVRPIRTNLAQHSHALIDGKHGRFGVVSGDGDEDRVQTSWRRAQ